MLTMSEVIGISEIEAKEVSLGCSLPCIPKDTCIANSVVPNKAIFSRTKRVEIRDASLPVPNAMNLKAETVNEESKDDVKKSLAKHSSRIVTNYIPSLKSLSSNWPLKTTRQQEVWGYWYQPDTFGVHIRSKTYLSKSEKVPNGAPPLLALTHFDFFQIKDRVDDVGGHKNCWLNRACPAEFRDRNFLIINIQVTTMNVHLVQYFIFNEKGSTGCERVDRMWEEFVRGSDEFRDQRLKMIPIIVEGPYLVRKSVPTKPCIIGTKVKNRYFRGTNYFEIDIETDSSYIARGVLYLIQNYSNYSVNLIWLLEAVELKELPERILAAAHLGYPEYQKAIKLENEWK